MIVPSRMAKKLTRRQIHGDDCASAALRQVSFVVGDRNKQWRRAQCRANCNARPRPKWREDSRYPCEVDHKAPVADRRGEGERMECVEYAHKPHPLALRSHG